MADKKDIKHYKCNNYGACAKADNGEDIQFDAIETLGGTPECPCCHQHTLEEIVKKPFPWKLIAIIAGVVVLLAIIGGIIAMSGSGEETPKQEPVAVAPVDSDSIKAAQMAAENQRLKDSLAAVEVANAKKQETPAKPVATPAPKPTPSQGLTTGKLNLSYGTYTGQIKGGYPNGQGRLVYSRERRISKYDEKTRIAQPGDIVQGTFVNGFITVGKHYDSAGNLQSSLNLGAPNGVYEDK